MKFKMAKIYTGINNYNEYYTNHYFSSIFEENASATISEWRDAARASKNTKTPWSLLKENAKSYYTAHEKYLRTRSNQSILWIIKEMADKYLESLGYDKAEPFIEKMNQGIQVPVYKEIKTEAGNPLLWILLSQNKEDDEDVLYGNIFDGKIEEEGGETYSNTDFNCEDLVTKSFFDNDNPPRWIIVIGINGIALMDRNKWNEKRYLGFDLKEIFARREESCLQAMAVLLHKDSLCPKEGKSLLDELNENSNKHAAGISQDLKYALRECIELLGNEVIYYFKNQEQRDFKENPIDAAELTMQCLRYMYRMLFVLFIEARPELGYAPMKDISYVTGYSLETLRDVVDEIKEDNEEVDNGYYLGDSINKLFHIIYHGYPENQEQLIEAEKMDSIHDAFIIEPLKAHIFDPKLTNLISHIKLRNCVMIKIIRLMSIARSDKTGKGRISYSNLGINQLGSVYEALLSYRGFIAEHILYEVKRAKDNFDELEVGYFISEAELDQYTEEERVRYESGANKGKPRKYEKGTFIYRLAGREREKSASYYTPEVLTKCLVKYALQELLEGKSADEILNLTICEPAMGSAAFLNEAINQLAESYINKKQEELGEIIPYEERYDQVQKVKMYIASRNIYGVDLNPTAVELAEVSLWLNTICKGGYVPWFGTQIVNGNSLIGARRQVYNTEQLAATNSYLQWYNKPPKRLDPGMKRNTQKTKNAKRQIYHFLTGDPGMCSYKDRIIKELEKEHITYMKNWNKEFIKPYTPDEIESLLRISSVIDKLWDKQVELRKEIKAKTTDKLSVYGHEDEREDSHTTIRQKDMIYRNLYKSEKMENAGPYARLKFAMDYWCSLWFWPIDKAELLPSRSEYIYDMSLILEGGIMSVKQEGHEGKFNILDNGQTVYQTSLFDTAIGSIAKEIQEKYEDLGQVNLDKLCETEERLALVRNIANENHFMHWELEFADLFEEKGGFDLMIGNPPWVKLEWEEQGVLSDNNPLIAVKKLNASQLVEYRNQVLKQDSIKKMYYHEFSNIAGQQNFLNAEQNYPLLKGQQTDLFKCFLPQAWYLSKTKGVEAFVHPEGIYDDPNGTILREELYTRLRKHFQFINELHLFADVHHSKKFSLNIYGEKKETPSFDSINDLFSVDCITQCYADETGEAEVPGIKDKNGNWNTKGHKNRIIPIGKNQLILFAKLFDGSKNWKEAKLPVIHQTEILDILFCFAKHKKTIGSEEKNITVSEMWHEVNAQKSNDIQRREKKKKNIQETIMSGPHIWIANPLYKTSRRECNLNSDYDNIDLTAIDEKYIQRCNYFPKSDPEKFYNNISNTTWYTKVNECYRIITRKMLGQGGERTLVNTIAAKNAMHINGLISFAFRNTHDMLLSAGLWSSIPFDFLIKTTGKSNMNFNCASALPITNSKYDDEIISRTILLNCLTQNYAELYQDWISKNTKKYEWSKVDNRLNPNKFKNLKEKWDWNTPLRTDYERRQALVEIDVLSALALGMTLKDLMTAYQIQFYILQSYENDTWYDANGRIVFSAKNRGDLTYKRAEFEQIKEAKPGEKFYRTITDDTMPGGPIERTIEYVAPFDKCDRIEDYKTAWEFFTKKYCLNKK